jgi:hypothetical protein
VKKKCHFVVAKIEAPESSGGGEGPLVCLDINNRWTRAAKVRKVLFAEKRKERQQDPETGGPLGQVGNQVL